MNLELDEKNIPKHVAIIMDGNGRWAKQRNMPRTMGHKAGVETIRKIVKEADRLGIKFITLYAFSTENWKRPKDEVNALMKLLVQYLKSEVSELHKNGVVLRVLGDISELQDECRKEIEDSIELTKNNIELVPLAEKYVKGFKLLVKDYVKEHNERMKTERPERKKTFNEMLNKSKSVVADELMFTATHKFFDNMSKDEIMRWADTCMDFVYNDLGYKKEQVLHATIHLDEKTPHIHCVVVPLVKKLDKRTNTERFTISKKQYIKDNIHLSELQDVYNLRLREAGFDLERGIKNSDRKHIKIKEFKKTTRYYEDKVNTINKSLDNAMNDLEEKMWKKKMQEGLNELREQLREIDNKLLKNKNNKELEVKDFQKTTIKCKFGDLEFYRRRYKLKRNGETKIVYLLDIYLELGYLGQLVLE